MSYGEDPEEAARSYREAMSPRSTLKRAVTLLPFILALLAIVWVMIGAPGLPR